MATGDAATAAGMSIMTGNEPANTLDTEINLTRDYIAQRTSTVTPIAKGGTGATSAAAARANLGAAATGHSHSKADVKDLQRDLNYLASTQENLQRDLNYLASTKAALADVNFVQAGNMSPEVYNRTLSGSYHVCYVDAAGKLGWVPSSREVKQNIETAAIDLRAVLAMEAVTFRYKIDPEGSPQYGLIAEDLHDLGLTWLVDYGPEGDTPLGVRYDLLALALLPALQDTRARVDALTARIEALEGLMPEGASL